MLLELAVSVLATLAFYLLFSFLWEIPAPLRSLPGDLKDDIALVRDERSLEGDRRGTASSSATFSLPPEIWLHVHRLATSESSPFAKASADRFQYEPIRDPLKDMRDFLRDARSFVLVCRMWHGLAKEILYENVRVDARFYILYPSLQRPSTARLVHSIKLSTIRFDHNYQILALCPQVQIVVQPDEVSTSMRATFVTLDPYRELELPQFDFLRHIYCSESLIASGLLHQVLRASPNLEHLFASSEPRGNGLANLAALPALKTLGLPVLGRSAYATSSLLQMDLRGLTRLQCTSVHLLSLEFPFLPSLHTLEIFGSGTTIPFSSIFTRCPCLRELCYDIWNNVTAPQGEQSTLSCIRLHSAVAVVCNWPAIERHFELFLTPEFPTPERVVLYGSWDSVVAHTRFPPVRNRLRARGCQVEFPENHLC
ncbi:hypothetical protein B0H10DRAFT_2083317 [Mycena sp. CBHHK59/15]|nr:hypothetical protein B0H10DRAFT_2100002 [Mycena sp. CBHHK59/15]KAJ6600630.1 hypothetical protein B0H10DRAFT_2083317 [Mycena sp. CBHHK59/15]